jgi:pseudouridine synthase
MAKRPRKNPDVPAPYNDAAHGPRLQKVMANAGVAARRDCETFITDGRVRVNGTVINTLPAFVDPATDRIEVDGRPLPRPKPPRSRARAQTAASKPEHAHVYVLLYKPRHVVSTTDDEAGRRTVIDLVNAPALRQARLYPVGRLDADSTGLILLTNDGELTHRLTHPSYEIAKKYRVSIKGALTPEDIERLKKGLLLVTPHARHRKPTPSGGGSASGPVKRATMSDVKLLAHQRDVTRGDRTVIEVTLHEGQNREIRRLLARLGFNVRRLQRTALGPLTLKGLASGHWRLLTRSEIAVLHRLVGMEA